MLTATTVSTTQHDSIITQKRFLAKWKLTGKMFFLEILKAAIQGQRGREVCTFSSVALMKRTSGDGGIHMKINIPSLTVHKGLYSSSKMGVN